MGKVNPKNTAGAWDRFVEETSRVPGTAVISMEFLAAATTEQITRIRDDLAGTRVEVVVTLRDLGRNVPAMWQERLKNGGVIGWSYFLRDLRRVESDAASIFWTQQAMADIVERWSDVLGADQVTAVTVPPSGADRNLLWERFCEAARFDGSDCPPVPAANTSLDAASVEVLREINTGLVELENKRAYHHVVKFVIAKQALPQRRGEPIGYRPPRWMARLTAEHRARIERTGVRVVGDLDELEPKRVPGRDPDRVPRADVRDAAVDALRLLVLDGHLDGRRRGGPGSSAPAAGEEDPDED